MSVTAVSLLRGTALTCRTITRSPTAPEKEVDGECCCGVIGASQVQQSLVSLDFCHQWKYNVRKGNSQKTSMKDLARLAFVSINRTLQVRFLGDPCAEKPLSVSIVLGKSCFGNMYLSG